MAKKKDGTEKKKPGRESRYTEPTTRFLITLPVSELNRIPGVKSWYIQEAIREKLARDGK